MKTLSRYVRGVSGNVRLVAYKTAADVVSKSVTLLITVAAARLLTPRDFGVLALAMATGWILGIATEAGLPLYLARAAAQRDRGALAPLFGAVMRLRASLATIGFAALTASALFWTPTDTRVAFVLIVAAQLIVALVETNAHLFRGVGRSDIESTITLITRLVTGALAAAILFMSASLVGLSIALVTPPALALVASLIVARRLITQDQASAQGGASLTFDVWRREAAPLAIGILLSAIYFRCDVYFVEYWLGLEAVGTYNAGFRLVEALRLIPAAALAVMFPALCQATTIEPLRRLALLLTIGGAALAVGILPTAPWLIAFLYGTTYAAAVAPLRVLALALPLFCLNYALTHQVIGWNGQRAYLAVAGMATLTSIVTNALLIPSRGLIGAATATVVTELVVTVGCLVAIRSHLPATAARAEIAGEAW